MTFSLISKDVFVFIKNLSDGKDSAYSRFMDSATFLIPNARTLTKIVESIDKLDMNNRDTMEEVVYEDPSVIFNRIEDRVNNIQSALAEFKSKYLNL